MNVAELAGAELDAAVARAEGLAAEIGPTGNIAALSRTACLVNYRPYEPTQRWDLAGPIIEREGIELHCMDRNGRRMQIWTARHPEKPLPLVFGESALVAAMRAFVASRSVSPPLPSVSPKGE